MAKAVKRKSPVKRKPATRSSSSWIAVSGWIVAAGLGAAWAAPQFGSLPKDLWSQVPAVDRLVPPILRDSTSTATVEEVPRSTQASVAAPVTASPTHMDSKKPVLPSIKADMISEIVRKAETVSVNAVPKPQTRSASGSGAVVPSPPASVPAAVPLVTAAIRRDAESPAPTARAGDLPIRRYPFTTAPTVAYVRDLRTIRILGGEGDWKKVEVTASGVTGWLRLQRVGASRNQTANRDPLQAVSPSPAPPVALGREAQGAR